MTHVIKFDEETLALHRRTQSPELAEFYVWWWENRHGAEVKETGLCALLRKRMIEATSRAMKEGIELQTQFAQCNLDIGYPFGREKYFTDRINGNIAQDENRIAWVRSHLPDSYKGPR